MDFLGKVAFITGAGGFLGKDNAKRLAKEGCAVALFDINKASLDLIVEEINKDGGKAIGFAGDITNSKDVDNAIESTVKEFGRLDIMLHVAGGAARSKQAPLIEQTDEVLESVLKINLFGAFYVARAAARKMIKQGEGGKMLFYSSTIGFMGGPKNSDYAVAKAGISGMVRALAKEWGPDQINVNAIAPGIVMRPEETGGDMRSLNTNLFHKKCLPEDISNLALFLVSDEAGFITGQTYIIDGGRSLSLKGSD